MTLADELDAITPDQLRATGALKWGLPSGAVGAFVAEMDFGTSPAVTDALRRELATSSFGYTSERRLHALQDATAHRLAAAHAWTVDPADIHPVADVISVLERTIALATDPGTPVVVPTPAYMSFFPAIRGQGREVIEVPMLRGADGVFRMDLLALRAAINRSGAQLAVLCNPHNPTGRVFTHDELLAFSEVIEATGVRVFADEIWAPIVFSGAAHIPYASLSPATAAHTTTAVSATKGWNIPGLKCAQAVLSNDADRKTWGRIQPAPWQHVAQPGITATIAAYRDRTGWPEEVTAYLEDCTAIVADAIAARVPQARISRPEGTYVCWIDVSALDLPHPASEHLEHAAGILLNDGPQCGSIGEGFLRLTAAMPRPVLRDAMDRLCGALAAASR